MHRLLGIALALAMGGPEAAAQRRVQASIALESEEYLFGHPFDTNLLRPVDLHPSITMQLPVAGYPAFARRVGLTGEVSVRVLIGTDNSVLYCEVTRRAVSAELTEAACPLIRRHGVFRHALGVDGTPREARMRLKVVFDLVVPGDSAVVYVPPAVVQAYPLGESLPRVLDPGALVIRGAPVALFPDTRRPMVHLSLDSRGVVARCSISVSSGTDRGDVLVCQTASAARFSPRRDRTGTAIDSVWAETLTVAR